MEQEITINKNIVSYLYNNVTSSPVTLEISDPQKCFSLLKQNYFITDKEKILLHEILNEINAIYDEQRKSEFKNVLGKLFLDRTKSANYSLDNSEYRYFKLCNSSNDKIYFDPNLNEEEIIRTKIGLFNEGLIELEIHCLKTFLNPEEDSKLINPNSKHVHSKTFEKNVKYNLTNELIPFLREAKEIKFIDNYLANYLARYHIEKLIKCVREQNKICNIVFITLSEEKYPENKKDIKKAKTDYSELEKLAREYKVSLENIEKSGHLERYIVTDKFEISLPGGFDQFSKDGKPKIKNENSILKMYVERR